MFGVVGVGAHAMTRLWGARGQLEVGIYLLPLCVSMALNPSLQAGRQVPKLSHWPYFIYEYVCVCGGGEIGWIFDQKRASNLRAGVIGILQGA